MIGVERSNIGVQGLTALIIRFQHFLVKQMTGGFWARLFLALYFFELSSSLEIVGFFFYTYIELSDIWGMPPCFGENRLQTLET